MNWWTIVLIISGIWALIGFITISIILKLKKRKPIIRKLIYGHLKSLPKNTVVTSNHHDSNYNYHLLNKDKSIEKALLFLQFKYEVAVFNQSNQQTINWLTNINYCHLFNHKHHNFTVTNILNHGIKHHLNILKPIHCLKKIFDKYHNKMNNANHGQMPKSQTGKTNDFSKNSINSSTLKANCKTQNVHNNTM